VTALADWLSLPPMTPETVRSFLRDPLRAVLSGRDDDRDGVRDDSEAQIPLMDSGLERC
jgi:hypothetical protein